MLGKALGGAVAVAAVVATLTPAVASDPGDPTTPTPTPSATGDLSPSPTPSADASPSPSPTPTTDPSPSPSPSPSPTTPPAATVISIGDVAIDPKIPSRVRVQLGYTCSAPEGARSLNTSVEQTDPTDPATVAFGATRTSPTLIVCDGTPQTQTVVVQSKTSNWIEGVDGVVVTTVSDLGATPPAAADAQQLRLDLPKPTA